MIKITLKQGAIELDESYFKGDVEKATAFVQTFCDKNNVTVTNIDRITPELQVNGIMHSLSGNVIDLNMMILYCGRRPDQFSQQHPHGKSRDIHFAAPVAAPRVFDEVPANSHVGTAVS